MHIFISAIAYIIFYTVITIVIGTAVSYVYQKVSPSTTYREWREDLAEEWIKLILGGSIMSASVLAFQYMTQKK